MLGVCASVKDEKALSAMSAPKSHGQLKELPVEDPHHVMETFVNDLIGIEVSNGVCMLTLGVRRMLEPAKGENEPRVQRIVVSRPTLSLATVNDLMNKLAALKQMIDRHKALSAQPIPEKMN